MTNVAMHAPRRTSVNDWKSCSVNLNKIEPTAAVAGTTIEQRDETRTTKNPLHFALTLTAN